MTQVDPLAAGPEDGTARRRAAALIKARRYDEAKGLLEQELIGCWRGRCRESSHERPRRCLSPSWRA
jgi:hypothetical protein